MVARVDSYHSSRIAKKETRYHIEDLNCCCFVRNINMRAATFEMNVIDISHDGCSICDTSLSCVAFKFGDILTATIDVNRKLFSRPINIRYKVIHTLVVGNRKDYGLQLLEVNDFHMKAYEEGLGSLKPERQTEHSLFHASQRKRALA